MTTYSVTVRPHMVSVSDDRGTVAGVHVTVAQSVAGTVIPIEGDSIDCWAERQLCRALPRDLLLALGEDAVSGIARSYDYDSDEPPAI